MTSISTSSAKSGSRPVSLPAIPELFNPNFLDVLIPATPGDVDLKTHQEPALSTPRNAMMDALKETANRTRTDNYAPAYSSTLSATLDAFHGLSRYTMGPEMETYLSKSWKEDPALTLRVIWNLRSIVDGKGEKEAFYRAFGWLYDNHPRTAISNLPLLVKPVCVFKKQEKAHGYWKDLLNIVALATVDELSNTTTESKYLHSPRNKFTYGRNKKKGVKTGTKESRIAAAQLFNEKYTAEAAARRKAKQLSNYQRLQQKLSEPKFAALYIAVARLFSGQLVEDMNVLSQVENLKAGGDRIALLKKISLAAKWAPTPNRSHDQVTNISTAISELIHDSQAIKPYPSALNNPLPAEERAAILRSFFQRWILTELRSAMQLPEPLMSSGRWKEIKYNRVASVCMKNNTPHFFKHDPEGFEAYLTSVENNKKTISGATLMPHELVSQVMALHRDWDYFQNPFKPNPLRDFKERLAEVRRRVVEGQWKTLVNSLRESGSLDNSVAVCDVSGSMGYLGGSYDKKHVRPIFPAVSLSLLMATLAKPPFNGGFITFSASPQYLRVDLTQPLDKQLLFMGRADWGMNTNLQSVFVDLLLPLAIKNQIKQEDMIKRLFIFSDMQFDNCQTDSTSWDTNYDKIEQAYKKAGYEVPQIVYWNLAGEGGTRTVEVDATRKGVAMMNGFSPAMLKVFMGEEEEDAKAEEQEWENVDEEGNSATVVEKEEEEFNPMNVMKKALARRSFDGLVVVD